MARPLTPFEKDRARAWMKERRGEMSQLALVEDIQRTIGWSITRDRYSKYESGGTDFGRGVLGKFVAYWDKKGKAGPDFTPPQVVEPPPDLPTALMAIASANAALTTELGEARREREAFEIRLRSVEAELKSLRARLEDGASPEQSSPHETTGSGR